MAAIPVEFAANDRAFCRCLAGDAVPHQIALLAHVGDSKATKHSCVVRLPTTSGIERRLVERHGAITPRDNSTFERREVRVAQVEQFGQ